MRTDETASASREELDRQITARLEAWLAAREEQERELERDVEIYDTRQPADSATGKPPLLARVKERERARIRNETDAKISGTETDSLHAEAADSLSAKDSLTSRNEASGKEKAESESREKRESNRAIVPAAAIMLLVILATVYVIFKRHSNTH